MPWVYFVNCSINNNTFELKISNGINEKKINKNNEIKICFIPGEENPFIFAYISNFDNKYKNKNENNKHFFLLFKRILFN